MIFFTQSRREVKCIHFKNKEPLLFYRTERRSQGDCIRSSLGRKEPHLHRTINDRKDELFMANKEYKFVDNYGFNETLLKEAFAEARKIYKEAVS